MEYLLLALPIIFLVGSVYLATRSVKKGAKPKKAFSMQLLSFFAVLILAAVFPIAAGAADTNTAAQAASSSMGIGLIAAAAATGLSCIGGGIAVAAATPAAIGATSEDPKAFGKALIFVAMGEGIALYGLLISIMILSKI